MRRQQRREAKRRQMVKPTEVDEPTTRQVKQEKEEEEGGKGQDTGISCFDTCSICRDTSPDDPPVTLPCRHVFHSACIEPWLSSCKDAPNCPYCRRDLIHPECRHPISARYYTPGSDLRASVIGQSCAGCEIVRRLHDILPAVLRTLVNVDLACSPPANCEPVPWGPAPADADDELSIWQRRKRRRLLRDLVALRAFVDEWLALPRLLREAATTTTATATAADIPRRPGNHHVLRLDMLDREVWALRGLLERMLRVVREESVESAWLDAVRKLFVLEGEEVEEEGEEEWVPMWLDVPVEDLRDVQASLARMLMVLKRGNIPLRRHVCVFCKCRGSSGAGT